MNKTWFAVPLAVLLNACVLAPVGRGPEVGIGIAVPALPLIVELGVEPYYMQGGYIYFYDNHRWRYARSRSGPWMDLPRSHYPRETRFKAHPDRRDRDGDRDRNREPDRYR